MAGAVVENRAWEALNIGALVSFGGNSEAWIASRKPSIWKVGTYFFKQQRNDYLLKQEHTKL